MTKNSNNTRVMRAVLPRWGAVAVLAALALAGCTSTEITTDDVDRNAEPRPDQLIVFNFATSPDEVTLDRGLIADVRDLLHREPRTAKEKQIGHAVADALATELVKELRAKGLPAVRAGDVVEPGIRPLQVRGQVLSIDEGNQTRRMIIGLGMGRSTVEARVQLFESVRGRADLLEQMTATTKSGRKPGMAEMIGVGALTGRIVTATILSGTASGVSEALLDNVDALAKSMAKKIAAKIVAFYQQRGWL